MAYVLAFRREEATFDVPRRTEMFSVTQQLVAPTIAQWGTPTAARTLRACHAAHRPHRVPAVLRDRGGSDLAAVRTRAVQGDGRALDHRRAQGLDVGRSGRRPRGRGVPDRPGRRETRRADRLPRADGRPRCHCPTDPADDRRHLLQRGLSRRGRTRRRIPAGTRRPGLEGRADRARRRTPRRRATSASPTPTRPSNWPGTSAPLDARSSATGSPT